MKVHKGFFYLGILIPALFFSAASAYSYTITASAGSGGSISPSGDVTVNADADQAFTVTPNAGFGVLLTVDNVPQGPALSYTFTAVTADHTIEAAFFDCNQYPVLLDWDYSPQISIMDAYNYAVGAELNDFVLRLRDETFTGFTTNLYFDANVSLLLDGGYDCSFTDNSGFTGISGKLTIGAGTVTTSNIVLTGLPPCAPGDPINFPGNPEICDGLDNNCNGIVDDGLGTDADGDGHYTIDSCLLTFTPADDCDDSDPINFPDNPEVCDGLDNNCDGLADEGLSAIDADGDGYSAANSCGGTANDCNDSDPAINPGTPEIYGDHIDQNCDGHDLIYPEEYECFGCHGISWTNYIHTTVHAPDPSCETCHGARAANIRNGHYGWVVITPGNNMAAGQTIRCTSCHDWHDEEYSGYAINGDYIVWAKVHAVGYNNVSCDTCHENFASGHETDNAHNNRVTVEVCKNCHTSDTAIIGQPGDGSLETAGDVDTLHRSDCNLCHSYTGTKLDPAVIDLAIRLGIAGTQVNCLTCHYNFETIHAFLAEHNNLIQVGTTGCGNCHYDPPPLTDKFNPKYHSTCANCHDGEYNTISLAAGKSFDVGGDCTTCHTNPFGDIHPDTIDHSAIITTTGTSCANCHSNPPPLVDAEGADDPKLHDGCLSCHDDEGRLINEAAGKSFAEGGNCTTCHGDDFPTIHPDTVDHSAIITTTGTSCANCHSNPPPLTDAAGNDDPKLHDECLNCHDSNGGLVNLAVGKSFAEGGNCATCHGDDFPTIHPDTVDHSLAIQLSSDCAGCHNGPPPLVDTAGNDDPKLHDGCLSCHDSNGGLVNLAAGNPAPNECTTCHGNDLGGLHPTVTAFHDATPGSADVVVFAAGTHDSAMIGDGTVYITCGTCHITNLITIHGSNCAACHSGSPSKYESLGGNWLGGCQEGACHTTYHDDVSDKHNDVTDYSTENNCTLCHGQDWQDFPPLPSACANCHATYDPNDTVPPVTTSDAQPDYIIPALITFTMTDNGGKVGIGTTYYILDSGPQIIGKSVLVETLGSHHLEFWSVDQAGNEELTHKTADFTISPDTTPPSTTSNAQSDYEYPAVITLTALDNNPVGVTTHYRINGGQTQTGNTVYVPELNGNYTYTLEFWSVDWSNNEELPHKQATFTIHGGTATIRLVWGDSDISGTSPCVADPEAWTDWEINRSGYSTINGSASCVTDPDWSGVNDIVVPVSLADYYVDIWWGIETGVYEEVIGYPNTQATTHGEIIILRY